MSDMLKNVGYEPEENWILSCREWDIKVKNVGYEAVECCILAAECGLLSCIRLDVSCRMWGIKNNVAY
jgi:hypothetical protein